MTAVRQEELGRVRQGGAVGQEVEVMGEGDRSLRVEESRLGLWTLF